ncbi:MAG: hypothetical protein DMF90_13885 [Acidobacteria bacterium]|nr:MAG: hypothetical protein DMF90_13885 [Acidobacteriota bacterium]
MSVDRAPHDPLRQAAGLDRVQVAEPAREPVELTPHAVGDLDGDGKADLVWRHAQTGDVAVWLMNGVTVKTGAHRGGWRAAGVADSIGSANRLDMWRQTQTGDVAVWLMNGVTVKQAPSWRPACRWRGRSPESATSMAMARSIWPGTLSEGRSRCGSWTARRSSSRPWYRGLCPWFANSVTPLAKLRPLALRAGAKPEFLEQIGKLRAGKHESAVILERSRNKRCFHLG